MTISPLSRLVASWQLIDDDPSAMTAYVRLRCKGFGMLDAELGEAHAGRY